MAGYWRRPEETAQVMTKDGFFRTGDIGVVDEQGRFKIVDRKKDMVLVSGFNVYPNEVEDVIAMHPGVLECAVIGVPDAASGEAVKAFVVKRDQALTEDELKRLPRRAAHQLQAAEVHRIPRRVAEYFRSARSCAARCATSRPSRRRRNLRCRLWVPGSPGACASGRALRGPVGGARDHGHR